VFLPLNCFFFFCPDPDRPKSLVEPPEIIPLSDEFLRAFGRREKAFDRAKGVSERDVVGSSRIGDGSGGSDDEGGGGGDGGDTNTIFRDLGLGDGEDDDDDNDNDATERTAGAAAESSTTSKKRDPHRKVKLANLKYTTSEETLKARLDTFGTVEKLVLVADRADPTRNNGLAYATFETSEQAEACAEQLQELDGRPIRTVLLKINEASSSSAKGGGGGGATAGARYYAQDISTKCYNCGRVGHIGADCSHPPKKKPCPLCSLTSHDLRECPSRVTCFNCGVPGHVSRDCRQPRGLAPRRICTSCFQSGHHRTQCHRSRNVHADAINISPNVLCVTCGRKGHYLVRAQCVSLYQLLICEVIAHLQ